jgi:FKBP-type peptidyl-prolyl cis-trans isomerase 2
MPVEKNNQVSVEYTGTLEDGTVFDSSEEHGEPLVYIAGVGMMIPGFDAAVIGMEIGEEKEITLQPEEAYGEYDERGIQHVPRSQFPKDFDPKVGMVLHLGTPNGDQFNAKVTAVDKKDVTLDLNHELAGKVLNFKLKVVDVGEPDERWSKSCDENCDSCGVHHDDDCGCGEEHEE